MLHVVGGDFEPGVNKLYPILHSVWHLLALASLYFVLDIPYSRTSVLKVWHYLMLGDMNNRSKPKGKRRIIQPRSLFGDVEAADVAIDVAPKRRDRRAKPVKGSDRARRKEEKRRQRRERDAALDDHSGTMVYGLYGDFLHT